MWPFRKVKPKIVKESSKKEISNEPSFEDKFENYRKIPRIYGIIKHLNQKCNTVRLDIGERPAGTTEQNRMYVAFGNSSYHFNEMSFVSDKLFSTKEEGFEYLLSKEKELEQFGICLDDDILRYKIKRTLKNLE